ncbi:MAG: 3-phosphoshikimate 1-carboxyvinyltransferase [Candidatus Peregrinibacteria bacterium]|nr:3-phosphoshikimate 1-carboxyvinyltransferase [Candidatus Peregrinibacteria bacterium]
MNTDVLSLAPLSLPFTATLTMPGSKSHANRAIIAACLSEGQTTIYGATPCDDVALLVKNLASIGFDIHYTNRKKGILIISGGIPKKQRYRRPKELFCGNAGTTLRFLTSLACIVPGEFVLTGNDAMHKRPIGDLVAALKALGADIEDTNGYPPIHIRGGSLLGGVANLRTQKSSQFLTSLLLIAPVLPQGMTLKLVGSVPSQSYVALTRQVMRDFGVPVQMRNGVIHVLDTARYRTPRSYHVEGDHSAAGAFLVLAELTHSTVSFSNLDPRSLQGDATLPKVIAQMRKKGQITIHCSDIPDQVMNLAVLAACRDEVTKMSGAENLRYKESDRLSVLTNELQKAGIRIEKNHDGVTVRKSTIRGALLDPHDDHRMAFCFAILGSLHPGIRIENPGCVSKSYPHFFDDLQSLHSSSRPIAIVGMRGCGKSTLGKSLAHALSLKSFDTDRVFERKHGNIRRFIEKHDWMKFRKEEERIVQACLQPGHVVSLGGGAIESKATRRRLREQAIVIHLKARSGELIERLKKAKRPSLTALPLEQEVPMILKKRTPLYQEVAHFSLPNSGSINDAVRSLRALCSL